jgi:hypothetical protein
MFNALSDRLSATFKGLRGKGRLSEADIDNTVREIRRALLEADVSLPVVRTFTSRVRERALSAEVSQSLNPAQQVVKIVNEELIAILGGETRNLRLAKKPPTVIMLLGLQGAGTRRCWSRRTYSGPTPSTSCRSSPSGPGWTATPRSRATALATRSPWPATRWRRPNVRCTTW